MSRKDECFCGFVFEEEFPKDFPDEFKLCCQCHGLAVTLAYEGFDDMIDFYTKILGLMPNNTIEQTAKYFPIIEKYKIINKLITINHEDD